MILESLTTDLNLLKVIPQLIAPLLYIFDDNKRIFVAYLISALVMIIAVYRWQSIKCRALLNKTTSKHYWLSNSGVLDIKWIFFNQTMNVLVVLPLLLSQVGLTMWVYRQLTFNFGSGDFIEWQATSVIALFTVVLFICDDFSRFLVHYLYHKVPFLWRFHAIHHSAEVLTPLTLYRVHIVEFVINSTRAIIISGTLGGLFIYCFTAPLGLIEILGVSIFTFVFNMLGANLRHSHVHIGFGVLEKIFISPAQHQIHHSSAKAHLDKNFGSCLAIWDRLFNCWLPTSHKRVKRFGLYLQKSPKTLSDQLLGISSTTTKQ